MSDPNATHHLLFGILSLQNGFISKEDLVAATSLWLEDKSVPLADLLENKFKLSADVRSLVDALVQKHLELYDGDVEKSLAAISSIGSVRVELHELGDEDVEKSLASIPENQDTPHTILQQRESITSSQWRFRILRPHARGGLGKVSIAEDEELHREVALKELLPQHADIADSRSRFLQEAEITGRLEHPGIVPVYGLGQYADGRPFYAMRFIRGDSLQDAIKRYHGDDPDGQDPAERTLELRNLLGRFIDVCFAIDYAHSRRVMHRDLKPGNIMVGKYGETLVVDWGLAKQFDQEEIAGGNGEASIVDTTSSGTVPTLMGTAVGTPSYMSPEQAEGRLGQLGPAADIYGLGATLYCVLTGEPPLKGASVEEVLRRVQLGDVPRPSKINPRIPKPLDAICCKAMAMNPRDRYESARDLAEDVERWLGDESVAAFADTFSVKLARWARRHRARV